MTGMDDIRKWLEIQPSRVKNNIDIVDNTDGQGPSMFHITYDRDPGKFIPVIGHRQGLDEDRSVPRICVAPTILGTILGHSSFEHNSEHLVVKKKDENGVLYRGGFYLFEFQYQVALKPNEKLVCDQKASDEHWLVTYNKNTIHYKPEAIGKVIATELSTKFKSSEKPRVGITYYVQVDKRVQFSKNRIMGPGCYKVVSPASFQLESWKDDEMIKVTKVSDKDFQEIKREVTVMESLHSSPRRLPIYQKW